MPVVRISEETFKDMEAIRSGFETPAALVARAVRFLKEHGGPTASVKDGRQPTKKRRIGSAPSLPQAAYREPLLECLHELGGKARTAEIRAAMERKLAARLGPADRALQPSGAEVRWWNLTMWTRKNLVEEGLLRDDSERGVWELSELGRRHMQQRAAGRA